MNDMSSLYISLFQSQTKQFISVNIVNKEQGYRVRLLNGNNQFDNFKKFFLHNNQKILRIETDTMENTVKFCFAFLNLFQLVVPEFPPFCVG